MRKLSVLALLAALIAALVGSAPAGAAKSPPTTLDGVTAAVTGTTADGGTVAGEVTLVRFASHGGELVAVGDFTGTVTDAAGTVLASGVERIVLPVTEISGSCQILHLELGPLDLDLLGLQVHLDQVVLDITAQSGPGNLLGNLLCAVAGLLDSNAPLSQLVQLLNQLLGLLG